MEMKEKVIEQSKKNNYYIMFKYEECKLIYLLEMPYPFFEC